MSFEGFDFNNIAKNALMSQEQCQDAVNAALGQSRLLGWILFGFALLVILLSFYILMRHKDIANLEKLLEEQKDVKKGKEKV